MNDQVQGKYVINDVLCFVFNHMFTLSPPAMRRLCLETYSAQDITQALKMVKDWLSSAKKKFDIQPRDDNFSTDEQALDDILHLLKENMSCLPQFVSSGRHIPRFNAYRDVLCMSSLLDEMQELKHMVKEMHTQLFTEILSMKGEFLSLKLKLGNHVLQEPNKRKAKSKVLPASKPMLDKQVDVRERIEETNVIATDSELNDFCEVTEPMLECEEDPSTVEIQFEDNKPICLAITAGSNNTEPQPTKKAKHTAHDSVPSALVVPVFDQKPATHRCDVCGYTSNRTDVTRHVRIHTGEKPFNCALCMKQFALRSNMLKHKRKHHKVPDSR